MADAFTQAFDDVMGMTDFSSRVDTAAVYTPEGETEFLLTIGITREGQTLENGEDRMVRAITLEVMAKTAAIVTGALRRARTRDTVTIDAVVYTVMSVEERGPATVLGLERLETAEVLAKADGRRGR